MASYLWIKRNGLKFLNSEFNYFPVENVFLLLNRLFDHMNQKIKDFIFTGIPRYDFYNNPKKCLSKEKIKNIKQIINKKSLNVLYPPRFRKFRIQDKIICEGDEINKVTKNLILFLDKISKKEDLSINLIVSYHPYERDKQVYLNSWLKSKKFNNNFNIKMLNDLPTGKIIPFVDFVITDYSSLLYEVIYLNKKLILFVLDYKKYIKKRGLVSGNFELFPDEIVIKNEDDEIILKKFHNLFNSYPINEIKILQTIIFSKSVKNRTKNYYNLLLIKTSYSIKNMKHKKYS